MLDGEPEPVVCSLISVTGSVGRFTCRGWPEPETGVAAKPAAMGFLIFEHHGRPVALRGAACAAADHGTLEFVVLDGVQLPERRGAPRVATPVTVRVRPQSDGPPEPAWVSTTTLDLSSTGARVQQRPGIEAQPRWELELALSEHEEPIRCGALVARRQPSSIGVAFTGMAPADQARLDAFLDQLREGPARDAPAAQRLAAPA